MSEISAHGEIAAVSIETAAPSRPRRDKPMNGSAIAAIGLVVLLAAWEGSVRLLHLPSYILPAPEAVVRALWSGLAVSPSNPVGYYQPLWGTFRNAAMGFGIGGALGLCSDRIPAGVALQRGEIDALAYYDAGFGQIEAAGIKLRYLPRPANLPMVGGQFLMTRRAVLHQDRTLAVGFGHSVCKASYFILANPAAGARAFLKMYPETAPRGSSTDTAVKAIVQAIGRRTKLYRPPYPGAKMGSINPAEFHAEAKLDRLQVTDVSPLYTNALIDEINDFDVKAIQAQAAAYRA